MMVRYQKNASLFGTRVKSKKLFSENNFLLMPKVYSLDFSIINQDMALKSLELSFVHPVFAYMYSGKAIMIHLAQHCFMNAKEYKESWEPLSDKEINIISSEYRK